MSWKYECLGVMMTGKSDEKNCEFKGLRRALCMSRFLSIKLGL